MSLRRPGNKDLAAIWLFSGFYSRSTEGMFFVLFSEEFALMKCHVWSVVFCCSFNRLSIGGMQSMECHGGVKLFAFFQQSIQ